MKKATKKAAGASRSTRSDTSTARRAGGRSRGASITEDIQRNTFTRDRQPGLYTRILRER